MQFVKEAAVCALSSSMGPETGHWLEAGFVTHTEAGHVPVPK